MKIFESHKGVVPKAVLRATRDTLSRRGFASGDWPDQQLIKQQVVGNAPNPPLVRRQRLSILALEREWIKMKSVSTYLNVSPILDQSRTKILPGVQWKLQLKSLWRLCQRA